MNEKLKKLARQDEIASMIGECQQAFPSNLIDGSLHIAGMTLRDYFAAKAMQTICQFEKLTFKNITDLSYELADAMMKARETE